MKCIHCNTDSKYPERQASGGRCPACKHPIAFEPKTTTVGSVTVSDGLFQKALQDISGSGSVAFTDQQLYYEFNRRLAKKQTRLTGGGCGVGAAVFAGSLVATIATGMPWVILGGIVGIGAAVGVGRLQSRKATPKTSLSYAAFRNSFLERWNLVHGRPERLALAAESAAKLPRRAAESDLTAYSFDRALVVDSPDIAAMLVANNFHFENNCAILSTGAYPPEPLRSTVLTMLRRNPRLQVFALHDASAEGCELPLRLRDPEWFPDHSVRIIDLGLRPVHAQKMRLMTQKVPPPLISTRVRETLGPEEIDWLAAGNVAELAVFRPERLMRSIYQGFARAGQLPAAGSGSSDSTAGDTAYVPGFIWFHDGGADVVASDSFG